MSHFTISRSALLHLRLPFSFFLLPIFLFALGVTDPQDWSRVMLVFFILHFLLYPASNGYNSYFDKDEGSIGGLEKPPPVSKDLYYLSLLLDAVAILLGLLISWQFAALLFVYGLVSKAYSHPTIRLKKYAITSWLVAGFFQGFFTFIMAYIGVHDMSIVQAFQPEVLIPASLSTLMLCGSYPMTQIYQHEEDARRGDYTISYRLGVLGTYHFTAIAFSLATVGFYLYYYYYHGFWQAAGYITFLIPVLFYFTRWYFKARRKPAAVNFRATMRLNQISGLCLNIFFTLVLL